MKSGSGTDFVFFIQENSEKNQGDFIGWSNDKCLSLANELAHLTNAYISDGCAASLRNEQYEKHYAQRRIRGVQLDLKYGLCFMSWTPDLGPLAKV